MCDTFQYALKFLYTKYQERLTSLLPWENYMTDFAQRLQAKGSVYPNLVGLVDGHFQPFCRPGGPGCVGAWVPAAANIYASPTQQTERIAHTRRCKNTNVFDFETYNGKEREHGLKSVQNPISLLSFTAQQVTHIASLCRFQAVCLPNGTGICHGPHWGPKHDSTMLQRSKLESELRTMTRRLRLPQRHPLCVYGDW